MAYFTFTPTAEADYREIRAFLTAEAGPETAERILGEIDDVCQRAADFPNIGKARPEVDPDLRSIPHDEYVIFYFPRSFGATIARSITRRAIRIRCSKTMRV